MINECFANVEQNETELVNYSISSCSHPQLLQIKNAWVV